MGFRIVLRKPEGHALEDNRRWARLVRARFPELAEDESDRESLAQDLAGDLGMTPREYMERGIGVALEREADDAWTRLSFWIETAEVELPNFPPAGIAMAVDSVMPLLGLLVNEGFTALDEATGRPFDQPLSEALRQTYMRRQAEVERVAEITGGTPG